ncbi:MAG TPA: dienelactone hydrolase family protein [Acetobacteraceae bacterium]|jgi:dienelactone hydrolase
MSFVHAAAAVLLSLAALAGESQSRADELVQVAPHRASASPAGRNGTPPLLGFLTRPDGAGRFPAVVLLHGCPGFTGHDTAAATTLRTWGYVGLALDSLGDANMCSGSAGIGAAAEMLDAYAALRYLSEQSFVASARMAIMGWSMGGTAALAAVEERAVRRAEQASVHAIVAYYPDCGASTGALTAPALILIGERDDWASAAQCRKLAAHESDIGTRREASSRMPIHLVLYPEARHGFDYRLPPTRYLGHSMEYDEAAARDAEMQVRDFLRRVLEDPS